MCLPHNSHRRIVHCVAETTCITNFICKRFSSFYKKALLSSYLIRSLYYKSSILCYTFTGYNVCAGEVHLFSYQPSDYNIMSDIVRTFRCVYGSKSPFEDVIRDIFPVHKLPFLTLIALLIHCCCLWFFAPKLVCVTFNNNNNNTNNNNNNNNSLSWRFSVSSNIIYFL